VKKNSFSAHFLDRASIKRDDTHWIHTQLEHKATGIIPVWESKVFCRSDENHQPVFLSLDDLNGRSVDNVPFIFLGLIDKKAYFAVDIDSQDIASQLCEKKTGAFLDFRQVTPLLTYQDCALLALARFMTTWHARHLFCGKCGHKTNPSEAGNARICVNDQCKQAFYPSMDPAVIVLVTSGEKCLLGRQKVWPKVMYSTIAGFVEPGESVEDAVFREVEEETGIRVENIAYQSSQPWLFPSSLMLGFTAVAKSKKILINKSELEDARWFSRKEFRENLDKGLIKLPMKVSIAYNLIEAWYDTGEIGKLKS
jgi:NAD+ diphosphatase